MAGTFGTYGIPSSLWAALQPPIIAGMPTSLPGAATEYPAATQYQPVFTRPQPVEPTMPVVPPQRFRLPIQDNLYGATTSPFQLGGRGSNIDPGFQRPWDFSGIDPGFGREVPGRLDPFPNWDPRIPIFPGGSNPETPSGASPGAGALRSMLPDFRTALEKAMKSYQDAGLMPTTDYPEEPTGMPSPKVIPWLAIGSIIAQALAGPHSNVGSSILGGYLEGERAKQTGEYQRKRAEAERKKLLREEQLRVSGLKLDTAREQYGLTRDEEDRQQIHNERDKAVADQNQQNQWFKRAYDPTLSLEEREKAANSLYNSAPTVFPELGPGFRKRMEAQQAQEKAGLQANAGGGQAAEQPTLRPDKKDIHEVRIFAARSRLSDQRGAQLAPLIAGYNPNNTAKIVQDEATAERLLAAKKGGWKNASLELRMEWDRLHQDMVNRDSGYAAELKALGEEAHALERELAVLNSELADAQARPDGYDANVVAEWKRQRTEMGARYRQIVGLSPALQQAFQALRFNLPAGGLLQQLDRQVAEWKQMLAATQPPSTLWQGKVAGGKAVLRSLQGSSRGRR